MGEIELSPDRRTVNVQAGYPLEGFCVKEPAGIDGTTAHVAVWMQGPSDVDDDSMCTAECGLVRQRLELDEPLPEDVVAFEPVADAAATCWTDPAPPLAASTTTPG